MKKYQLSESKLIELIEHTIKKNSVNPKLLETISEKYKTWDIDYDGRIVRKTFRNEIDENGVKIWCEKYFDKEPKTVKGVNLNEDIDLMWSKLPLDKDKSINEYKDEITNIVKKTDNIRVKKQGLDLLNKLDSNGDIVKKEMDNFINDNKITLNEQPEIAEPEVKPDVKPQIKPDTDSPKRQDPRKRPFTKPEHIEPDSEPTPAKALIENKIKLSKSELEKQGIKYNPDCKYYKKGDFIYKVRNDGNYTCYKDGKVHNLGKNFDKIVGEKKNLTEQETDNSIIGKKIGDVFPNVKGINKISDKVITYAKKFTKGDDFSAITKAEKYLENEGYDKGSMYMSYPIPFMLKGKTGISDDGTTIITTKHGEKRPLVITKYDRLDRENWDDMDGALISNNFREDDVYLIFFNFPD